LPGIGSSKVVGEGKPTINLEMLLREWGKEILGKIAPTGKFPLIVKYLDIHDKLSVQVHPDDLTACQLGFPDQGKYEAWVVLEKNPEARIWAGFSQQVDPSRLSEAIRAGELWALLHEQIPEVGQCYFFPPGTVHAAGGGLLVAEVQQASDITFRLFDWNRIDDRGESRPLHLEEAFRSLRWDQGPVKPCVSQQLDHFCELLVQCPKFELRQWQGRVSASLPADGRCRILICLEGKLDIRGQGFCANFSAGQTILIPIAALPVNVNAAPPDGCWFLEVVVV
jgi:mannose-6-phosphate isomerase